MTPLYKEYVLDFADLKLLGIVCRKCNVETILDLSDQNARKPSHCPSCQGDFDGLFTQALNDLHNSYLRLTEKTRSASVRIRIRSDAKMPE